MTIEEVFKRSPYYNTKEKIIISGPVDPGKVKKRINYFDRLFKGIEGYGK